MAAIASQIQANVIQQKSPRMVRDSGGNYYGIFVDNSSKKLYVVKSINGGASWTQEQIGSAATHYYCSIGIDNQDNLHILYSKGTVGTAGAGYFYRKGTFGNWGVEETVIDTSSYTTTRLHGECALAIDNNNYVHTNISVQNASTFYCYYTIKTSTWGASTHVLAGYTGAVWANLKMIVDKNGYVWSFGSYSQEGYFWSYKSSLASAVAFTSGYAQLSYYDVGSDSSGNLYVVMIYGAGAGNTTQCMKYTAATLVWSAISLNTPLPTGGIGTGCVVDGNNKIWAFRSDGTNIKYTYSTDAGANWAAGATLIASTNPGDIGGLNLMAPVVGGSKPSRVYSGHVWHYSIGTTWYFYSSDGATFDALATKDYSRNAETSLPANDSPMTTKYTAADYINVADDDNITVDQSAPDKYAVHLFRNKGTDAAYAISVAWTGQSDVAPTSQTVYLQIFNRTSGLWETLSSNNTTAANTKFTLTGVKSTGLSDYYDANLWVSCRIYQHA